MAAPGALRVVLDGGFPQGERATTRVAPTFHLRPRQVRSGQARDLPLQE